jgi:hypothetical protein
MARHPEGKMVVTTDIHKSAWSIVADFTCGSYQTRLGAAPAVAGGVVVRFWLW